jgi:hypothetical protein
VKKNNMSVPNAMWSCAVSTVVFLRNRTFNSAVGISGSVPLTLLTQVEHDASKFRVFGGAIFAKVPDKLRRKLGEKAFRGVMVGFPPGRPRLPCVQSGYTAHHYLRARHVPGDCPRLHALS